MQCLQCFRESILEEVYLSIQDNTYTNVYLCTNGHRTGKYIEPEQTQESKNLKIA
jgi:hypothetical protein